jgi:hypothetical protein
VPTVTVTVSVRPARGEATFRIVPQIRNVGTGLVATIGEPITITLAGDIPTLDALTPEAIVATADAQGLGPGFHALPLQITAPSGTTVVATNPPELGLALSARQQ